MLKESTEAEDFKKLKTTQNLIVKDTVGTVKEDLFKRGYAKHRMSMIHVTDWRPGSVTEKYRGNYDSIKWN